MTVSLPVLSPEQEEPPDIIRGSTTGANCHECPFGRNGKPGTAVMGIGSERPLWIIVGESPGQNEVKFLEPFVGASGGLVNQVLRDIKVQRSSIWITNSALCIEPNASEEARRQARRACAPRLKNELAQFPNRPILALGAIAAQGFCGEKFSITQMAGAHFEVDVDGSGELRSVIPSIHPAAILRGSAGHGGGGGHTSDLAYWNLQFDAQKVNQLARGRDIKFSEDVFTETRDPDKALALLQQFAVDARAAGIFALDTETYVKDPKRHTALSAYTADLSAIGLATEKYGISITWDVIGSEGRAIIAQLLADASLTCVMHNMAYDVAVLTNQGFVINTNMEDTMLAHHNAFPGLAHGLQRVTTQLFLTKPWKSEFRHGQGTPDELTRYCALDTTSTARIHSPLQVMVKRSLADRTYEIDKSMARVAAQMHLDGVPVDPDVNSQLRNNFKTNIDQAITELHQRLNEPAVYDRFMERLAFEQSRRVRKHDPENSTERQEKRRAELDSKPFTFLLDSGDHIVAFLKACGVPLSLQTKSGRISTKKEILESFAHHLEVRSLLTYRENSKLLNTFVERFFDRILPNGKILPGLTDINHRLHPRWSVHKITGRWGAEGPACFDGETEILTERGWVKFPDLLAARTDRVAQFDLATSGISFVAPTSYVQKHHQGVLHKFTSKNFDALVTPDHRFAVQHRKSKRWRDVEAQDLPSEHKIPVAGQYVGGDWDPTWAELAFFCAAQADGSWNGYGWDFSFSRPRKIERLRKVLQALGLEHREDDHVDTNVFTGESRVRRRFYVHQSDFGTSIAAKLGLQPELPGRGIYGSALLTLSKAALDTFCAEVYHWDGSYTRKNNYSSSQRESVDWVQIAFTLSGKRAHLRAYTKSKLQKKTNWQLDISDKWFVGTVALKRSTVDWNDPVYCVSVPSSYIVVRRNGRVAITGNCQNWPKADKKKGRPNLRSQVVAPQGRQLVAFDAKQLEARTIALLSGDTFLNNIFKNGRDIHTEFAKLIWTDFDQRHVDERKVLRDLVKRPEYCLVPGTRVLKRDMTWVAIETLQCGDELVGFSAAQPGKRWTENYFKPSTVVKTKLLKQPCYRITTTKGTVVASDEHLWVGQARNGNGRPWKSKTRWAPKAWLRTDQLVVGDRLMFTSEPWSYDTSREAGYLAGLYDGEGWVSSHKLGFAQNRGVVLEATEALLNAQGFEWIKGRHAGSRCVRTEIKGGFWEALRFLGTNRPLRLLPKSDRLWEGRRLRGKGEGAEVLSVEFVGEREVVAIQTSTETFIAEGFLSHNCTFYAGAPETAWKAVVRDYPNVTLAAVNGMVMSMKQNMPGVVRWHQQMIRQAGQHGEIRSAVLGRRRCFPIKEFDASEAINFGAQSTGADIINTGLHEIMPQLPPGTFPILQIHDAVVFETDEDDVDLVKALVVKCFTQQHTYNGVTVDFPVDAKSGSTWAEVN